MNRAQHIQWTKTRALALAGHLSTERQVREFIDEIR